MSFEEENEGGCLLAEDARLRLYVKEEGNREKKRKEKKGQRTNNEKRRKKKKKGQERVLFLNGCATERQQTAPPDLRSEGTKEEGDGMDAIGCDESGLCPI